MQDETLKIIPIKIKHKPLSPMQALVFAVVACENGFEVQMTQSPDADTNKFLMEARDVLADIIATAIAEANRGPRDDRCSG